MLNLPIAEISNQTLSLNNLLRTRAQQINIDEQLTLNISLGKRPRLCGYQIQCLIGANKITFFTQEEQLQTFLDDALQGTPFKLLPELLQLSFLSAEIIPYQGLLANKFGQQMVITAIKALELDESNITCGYINLVRDQIGVTCWIEANSEFIFNALPQAKNTLGPHIPLPYALAIGQTSLSLKDAQSLEAGDIIFFDINYLKNEQAVLMIANRAMWRCHLVDNRITLIATEIEKPMSSDNTDIQSLPINISFEIGEQLVTVAELSQLQEQFVFELSGSLDQVVKLKANGKVLATGELVKVNDHLGVRVINLMNQELN
ncbi:type III secretion system cytoplasmic ring protein SctQ [Shewanella sp. SR44-3]|uniref:type III secretion system cytoplasmic ring protein SctQ n=1 Tax=unclassified Shewanella TaxID=196818 RepID=UPI0015FBA872|nr:type III secretion system cytoplasmic ring protein SctQ [Shewanella sp. SR44-3]MBB1268976.1 type III secretion system cytoplasmic ring protein SctQ [Shewanella sp. SR44-3]